MRIITNEELLAVVGGSSLEGSDGSEDLMDGADVNVYFVDDGRKVKTGGGGAPSAPQNTASAGPNGASASCKPPLVPKVTWTQGNSTQQGQGSVSGGNKVMGGQASGGGSNNNSGTQATATCAPAGT